MDTLLLFKCDRKHTYIFHNLIDGVFLGISAVQLVHQVRDCNVTSTIYVRIYVQTYTLIRLNIYDIYA